MCYNILNNLVDIDSDAYFKRSKVHQTRGNNMKLNKSHAIVLFDIAISLHTES